MYQPNEGPRASQQSPNTENLTTSAQPLLETAVHENLAGTPKTKEQDAMTTRTPERWWLRKRLMQG